MKLLFVLFAMAAIGLASPEAMAQWNEQGDAGELPGTAQSPVGAGALTSISGSCTTGTDVDMYCIHIDGDAYVANTCSVTWDTQLWLFRSDGVGLAHNDDNCGQGPLQSGLAFIQPGAGDYLLAISRFDRDPANAGGSEIWADVPYEDETPPDGPGAPGPVVSWVGSAGPAGAYRIDLLGVSYCQVTPVEPSTWGKIKSIYRN